MVNNSTIVRGHFDQLELIAYRCHPPPPLHQTLEELHAVLLCSTRKDFMAAPVMHTGCAVGPRTTRAGAPVKFSPAYSCSV